MHVSEIISGLDDIAKQAFSEQQEEAKYGLLALKVGCQAFSGISNSGLPIIYDLPLVKECCFYASSAMDLVRYYRKIPDKKKLKSMRKHLRLIGAGYFGLSGSYMNQQNNESSLRGRFSDYGIEPYPAELRKDASRKAIELMIALAALNRFEDVELEDPEDSNSSSPNPDVIITHDQKRYGIACKSISSKNTENLKERILEGVNQIERSIHAKTVDPYRGVVLIDVSSLLDHDALYLPDREHVWSFKDAGDVIVSSMSAVINEILENDHPQSFKDAVENLFEGSKAAPAVLVYANSCMICANSNSSIFPAYMKAMTVYFAGDHSPVKSFLDKLNKAIHCQ